MGRGDGVKAVRILSVLISTFLKGCCPYGDTSKDLEVVWAESVSVSHFCDPLKAPSRVYLGLTCIPEEKRHGFCCYKKKNDKICKLKLLGCLVSV